MPWWFYWFICFYFVDYFRWINVLLASIYVYMYACCPGKLEEGVRSLGTEVIEDCEVPGECWERNPGRQQETQVL